MCMRIYILCSFAFFNVCIGSEVGGVCYAVCIHISRDHRIGKTYGYCYTSLLRRAFYRFSFQI